MFHTKMFGSVVAILMLLHYAEAQQNCINTCTDSANVLTQMKTCSGCETDDWACFCRCRQYTDALLSCAQQYCSGTDITNSIVSFCADQGVNLPYSSTSSSSTNTMSSSSSASSTSSVTSNSASSTATTSSGSSLITTDASDISIYLSSAIPSSARTDSSVACFVNTPYSYYSTPTWYSSLPTQAQSYYSSVNQGNTAACTLSPAQAAALAQSHHGGSGLSAGAIAGIVIGAILAALLIAALIWLLLRKRRRARRDAAVAESARSERFEPRAASYGQTKHQVPYWSEKGGPNGLTTPASAPIVPAAGAAYGGNNEKNQPWTHTTTTTTRTVIRPKHRVPGQMSSATQTPRPPPQPIPNHAFVNHNESAQSIPRKPVARRAF